MADLKLFFPRSFFLKADFTQLRALVRDNQVAARLARKDANAARIFSAAGRATGSVTRVAKAAGISFAASASAANRAKIAKTTAATT